MLSIHLFVIPVKAGICLLWSSI